MAPKKSVKQVSTDDPTGEPSTFTTAKTSPVRRTTRNTNSNAQQSSNAPVPIPQQLVGGTAAKATREILPKTQRSPAKPNGPAGAHATLYPESAVHSPSAAEEDDSFEEAREELRLFRDDVQERLAEVERATAERVALSENHGREMMAKISALENQTSAMNIELGVLREEVVWCRTNCSELSREGRVEALERKIRELNQ